LLELEYIVLRMPIRLKNVRLLLFGLFFLYLAAVYFGGALYTVFTFALALVLLSLAVGLVGLAGFKLYQHFDTEHPVKGEQIHYQLSLSNEAFLPVAHLHCRFKTINPHLALDIPGFSTFIGTRDRIEREYTFRCSYRGIYTVGLESIEIEDPLRLLSLKPRVEYRTFYVYPRVLELERFPLGPPSSEGMGSGTSRGGDPDYALYTQFREARDGEPIRHLHWKKFVALGKPYIRQFETTAEPGIRIYFDLRPVSAAEANPLEIEDTSVEILVALVRYSLGRGIPTSVVAPGREVYQFSGQSRDEFEGFYRSTMQLFFQDTVSPAAMYLADSRTGAAGRSSVFFVSHLLDASLFGLAEQARAGERRFTLVLNQTGRTERQRAADLIRVNRLRERGTAVFTVGGPETIVEDLQGARYEAVV